MDVTLDTALIGLFGGVFVAVLGLAVRGFQKRLDDMNANINARFTDMNTNINSRFEDVKEHFVATNKRIDETNKKMDNLADDVKANGRAIQGLSIRVAVLEAKLDTPTHGQREASDPPQHLSLSGADEPVP